MNLAPVYEYRVRITLLPDGTSVMELIYSASVLLLTRGERNPFSSQLKCDLMTLTLNQHLNRETRDLP